MDRIEQYDITFEDFDDVINHILGLENLLEKKSKYNVHSTLYLSSEAYIVKHEIEINGQ